jgi:putative ABC transport system substrate-binding protein
MLRRDFIMAMVGATSAWPACAQTQRTVRIGYLGLTPSDRLRPFDEAFRDGLRELGYVEGRNLHIEFRSAEGHEDRLPGLAAELAALNVDVIVTYATGVIAAHRATKSVPIVMATHADAVALTRLGVIANLAHPGGNVTGSTFFVPEIMAKRLEVLKEFAGSMTRAGVLLVPREDRVNQALLEAMAATGKTLAIELHPAEVRRPEEIGEAFSAWAAQNVGGVVMLDHAQLLGNADMVAALALRHRLPSIGPLELVASGGLIGFGVNFFDMFRRAASFVDKIVKGEKPGNIPVEQATKFKLVLNLKVAKALGLDVPAGTLLRADEVIE